PPGARPHRALGPRRGPRGLGSAGRRRAVTGRLRRLAVVAALPTLADVALLVLLREHLGWILVLADLTAVAVASVLSYVLHRVVTFRSDPFVRWVRMPWTFAAVAVAAAAVDVV